MPTLPGWNPRKTIWIQESEQESKGLRNVPKSLWN